MVTKISTNVRNFTKGKDLEIHIHFYDNLKKDLKCLFKVIIHICPATKSSKLSFSNDCTLKLNQFEMHATGGF